MGCESSRLTLKGDCDHGKCMGHFYSEYKKKCVIMNRLDIMKLRSFNESVELVHTSVRIYSLASRSESK